MSDLRGLAAEAGAASADQQVDILNDAWDALGPYLNWTADQARQFGLAMDDGAFVSAALMFAPRDWNIEIGIRPGRTWCEFARPGQDPLLVNKYGGRSNTASSLAILQGALVAHAKLIEEQADGGR